MPPALVRTIRVKVLFGVADAVALIVSVVDPDPDKALGEKL